MAKKTVKKKKKAVRRDRTAKATRPARPTGTAGTAATGDWKPDGDLKELWNEHRTVIGGGFEVPDIPNGTYVARLTSTLTGEGENGFYFRLGLVVTRGDHDGTQLTSWQRFNNEVGARIAFGTLQALGYETEQLEAEDLPRVLEEIAETKPVCRVRVRNREYEGRPYQDVYVNEVIEEG